MISEEILRGLGFLRRPVREREVARLLNEEREREAARPLEQLTAFQIGREAGDLLWRRRGCKGPCSAMDVKISRCVELTEHDSGNTFVIVIADDALSWSLDDMSLHYLQPAILHFYAPPGEGVYLLDPDGLMNPTNYDPPLGG
jgi:hypothetical protein